MSDAEWSQEWIDLEAGGTPPQSWNKWSFWRQLWKNLAKRTRVGSAVCANQPLSNFEWLAGTIGTVSTDGTTITVTDASSPAAVFIDGDGKERWVGWPGGSGQTFNGSPVSEFAPEDYDVVINTDDRDPSEVGVPLPIIDSTQNGVSGATATSLKVADDGKWAINHALSFYNGKRYAIIKRNGTYWNQRVPQKPSWFYNNNATITSSTTTTLTDSTQNWAIDRFAGEDLITIVNGQLKRIAITSNTENVLTFPVQSHAPASGYYITAHETYWPQQLAPAQDKPLAWYTGLMDSHDTHYPDDLVAAFSTIATDEVLVDVGDSVDVYYFDAYRGVDETPTDHIFAVDLPKCLGWVQEAIHDTGGFFVINVSLIDSTHAVGMTVGDPALMYRAISGNYYTKTITAVGGGYATWSGSITFPDGETSRSDAYVSRLDSHEFRQASIENAELTATTVTDAGFSIGDIAVISLGGLRAEPRRVSRLHERWVFVPDVEYDGFGEPIGVYDPPTDDHTGQYVHLDPDTNYAVYTDHGIFAPNGGRAFVTNEKVRYVGNNKGDPTSLTQGAIEDPLQNPYYDYLCVCNSPPTTPRARNQRQWKMPDTSGTIISATATSITVDKHLWDNTTPRKTHTGTFTSGSTASGTDSTKATDPWFLANGGVRFENVATIQLEVSTGVWEKKFCLEQNTVTTLVPHSAFSVSANGKAYKVIEPAGLNGTTGPGIANYLRDHVLRVTSAADGSTHDGEILGHDDDTIFFQELTGSYTPVAGDAWEIRYFRVGSTLKWNGTRFVDPDTGEYPGDGNISQRLCAIEPTIKVNYGRIRKGDRVDHPGFLVQFKKLIDILFRTVFAYTWDSNGEDNNQSASATKGPLDPTYSWANLRSDFATNWAAATPIGLTGAPFVISRVGVAPVGPFKEVSAENQYSYLSASPFYCERFGLTTRDIECWAYATSGFLNPVTGQYQTGAYDVGNNGGASGYIYYEPAQIGGSGGTGTITFNVWNKILSITSSSPTVLELIGDDTHTAQLSASNPTITDITEPINYNGQTYAYIKNAYLTYTFALVDWQSAFDADT